MDMSPPSKKARTEETTDVPVSPTTPQLKDLKLGFIGWGAMAQAISLGLLKKEQICASSVMATDVVPDILAAAVQKGIGIAKSNIELVEWADIIFFAVKPQVVDSVLKEIAPHWRSEKIVVSICAGVTIQTYQDGLNFDGKAKIVRVMPNTPCLIGEAATAYAGSDTCEAWELELVHGIFASCGSATHRLPEYLLNAVTGLSGSGPAYVYMLINAMSDAGVHGGLPRNVALSLATQTVVGAAKMVQQTGQHPAVLKEAVTSPAGTTIAGVRALEKNAFNSTIMEAVEAASARSEELSRPKRDTK